jgi:hypothetical protein
MLAGAEGLKFINMMIIHGTAYRGIALNQDTGFERIPDKHYD